MLLCMSRTALTARRDVECARASQDAGIPGHRHLRIVPLSRDTIASRGSKVIHASRKYSHQNAPTHNAVALLGVLVLDVAWLVRAGGREGGRAHK